MTQRFIQAVNDRKLNAVRIALINSLNSNPTGDEFNEMLEYANARLDDLFEENKEAYYDIIPEDEWNVDFMDKVANDLEMNFSVEKLAFYKAVIEKVRANDIVSIRTRNASNHEPFSDNRRNRVKKVGITVATGGAVLTVVGICKGISLLTLIGSAILIGGVTIAIKSTIRK
ncbi:MAG: hypothetical protein K2N05_12330 [Muribaculaceae bacterium]|nr:hypothetical protein [Muribaculaceae bacterium]